MRLRLARLHCVTLAALTIGWPLLRPTLVRGAETNPPPHARWEAAIQAFEAADRTNPPPRNAIEFVGSSSIRLWTTLEQDFAGHRVFKRGFGGSELSDAVAFAERIVIPYRPRLVVLYAGDNDLAGGKSPERVFADFQAFVAKVRAALPETRVAFLSIKPSPSRMKFFAQAQAANRLIREFIAADSKLVYVDVFTPMLGRDRQPRAELFVGDRLHLNAAGYKLWAGIVGPVLDKLDPPTSEQRLFHPAPAAELSGAAHQQGRLALEDRPGLRLRGH